MRKFKVFFFVLVLKLVFFKLDERGLEFFWDFCCDLRFLEWILCFVGFLLFDLGEVFNGRRLFSFEFNGEIENISVVFDKEIFVVRNDLKVDEIL